MKQNTVNIKEDLAELTPYSASLVWRCRVATAADYETFLIETEPAALQRWGEIYKTGDIKQWASERVDNLEAMCAELWPLFGETSSAARAQNAAQVSLVSLARLGWSGFVPIATKQDELTGV